jgi:hypothetical protein
MQPKGGAISLKLSGLELGTHGSVANWEIHDTIFLTNSATGNYVSIFTLRE